MCRARGGTGLHMIGTDQQLCHEADRANLFLSVGRRVSVFGLLTLSGEAGVYLGDIPKSLP